MLPLLLRKEGDSMDLLESEITQELWKAITHLKAGTSELEARLRENTVHPHQGGLRSIGIRVLVSAERIDHLLTTLAAREKLKRAAC
jgi:hypothetical protein